jgi:preprotein translocase subunit SecE
VATPHRRVAQLAELWSPKPVVVGSSPAAPASIQLDRSARVAGATGRRERGETRPVVRRIRRFIDEAWSELKKVTWPTREQTRNLTVLVFVISAAVGIYITIFDVAFTELVRLLTLQAGGGQ